MPGTPRTSRPSSGEPDPVSQLRHAQGILGALVGRVAEGVCLVRASTGTIAFADAKFANIFGYAEKDLHGQSIDIVDGPGLYQRVVTATADHQKAATIDLDCHRKDGTRIVCAWSGTRLGQGDEAVDLLVVQDVTNRRKAEALQIEVQQRQEEIQRLRELDQVKTQFINNAAHELKTPLTPVKVQTHLLRTALSGGLSPDQRQSVDILHRNLERLRHLVDDVLEAARIQANRLKVTLTPLDLNPLVLETVESFKAVAAQVGVTIEWRYCEAPHVEGDTERLTQVVYNLLSNAVKFTPPGGKVTVETSKSHNDAFVRVQDTGRGLNSEQISKLFKPFGQVHDPMQETRAGTGLGLFISAGIMQEHHGRIWAESPGPGRGSTFAISLPLTAKPIIRPEARVAPERISMRPAPPSRRDPALERRLRELI